MNVDTFYEHDVLLIFGFPDTYGSWQAKFYITYLSFSAIVPRYDKVLCVREAYLVNATKHFL